jgi:hypothetical protein
MNTEHLKHFAMTALAVVAGLVVYNSVLAPMMASMSLAAPATTTTATTATTAGH